MKHSEVRERNMLFLSRREEGKKLREIAKEFNTPINTVLSGINKEKSYGSIY